MWEYIVSLLVYILHWLSMLYDGVGHNEFPVLSTCADFKPNTQLSSESCAYGFSGRFCDECGLVFKKPNVKIVGGVEATPNSWPALVFVLFSYTYLRPNSTEISTKQFLCGGSLIDRQTVLTAAHCFVRSVEDGFDQIKVEPNEFHPDFGSMYKVYLGLHNNTNVFTFDDIDPAVLMEVKDFILHPQYNTENYANDIAIIRLKAEVELDCGIQIACLPPADFSLKESVDAWAAGWGVDDQLGNLPDVLKNVKMTLFKDINKCNETMPSMPSKQLCAGSLEESIDVCSGDSGGPLYIRSKVNGKDKYVLVGLVSYGPVPCGVLRPGVYTKISAYLNWINEFRVY